MTDEMMSLRALVEKLALAAQRAQAIAEMQAWANEEFDQFVPVGPADWYPERIGSTKRAKKKGRPKAAFPSRAFTKFTR